jgi:hypothetical protein
MKERKLLLAVAALVIVIAAAFALSSPREGRLKVGEDAPVETAAGESESTSPRRPASQLCSSSAGYQQLKAAAFEQAIRVRGEPANLTRLAATSVVRMENPVVTSEEGGDTATCSGRLVIELPPGAERGADGQRRLAADVVYTAQTDGDGGIIYRLTEGEAIVSSLAAFDIDSSLQPAPAAAPPPVQVAEASEPEEEGPVIIRPDPADRPAPRPTPPRPRARAERVESTPRPAPARPAPSERAERAERAEPAPRRSPPARPAAERTARPSFNCASARSRSERLVCGSERLAAKDRAMSSLFFSSLNDADPRTRAELQRTRNRFLAYRDRCQSEECIAEAYDGRMQEIRDIVELAEN